MDGGDVGAATPSKSFSQPQKKADMKKGTKRKIPLLSQVNTPMHELSSNPVASSGAVSLPDKFASSPKHSEALLQTNPELDISPEMDVEFEDEFSDWKRREDNIRHRVDLAYNNMKHILDRLTPEQSLRYDTFRRSRIQGPLLKKWMSSYSNFLIHPNISIVMAGISKVFVGELVEAALQLKSQYGNSGPLLPSHIRAAYIRLNSRSGSLSKSFVFQQKRRSF